MSPAECSLRYISPSLTYRNEYPTQLESWSQFDPLPRERNPTRAFEDSSRAVLDFAGPIFPEAFDSSLWSPQTRDCVQYDQEDLFPFDHATVARDDCIDRNRAGYAPITPIPIVPQDYKIHIDSTVKGIGGRCYHECLECGQKFDSLQSLEQHSKNLSHKIFKCPAKDCKKAYPRRDSLARHQLKHSSKSHPCVICQRGDKSKFFKRKDHLAEHTRKCHSSSSGAMRSAFHQCHTKTRKLT